MPGVPNKPEIFGALVPVEESESVPQPRQPTNLQGLLRFATEATKNEDAPASSDVKPMDDERKEFLMNALQSMTVDVVDLMKKQIEILKNVGDIKEDGDIGEYEQAFEVILDYVDNIDIANDFHKIGGFCILKPCLEAGNLKIRSLACELIATLCQNNLYCQRCVISEGFVPILIELIRKEANIKALYAISCIVRSNSEGFDQLVHYNGIHAILEAMKAKDEKFITKSCFLFNSLCNNNIDLKSRLIFLDIIEILSDLLTIERNTSHEHILNLFMTLALDNRRAIFELRNEKYNLRKILTEYLDKIPKECREEEETCKRLIDIIFEPTDVNGYYQ